MKFASNFIHSPAYFLITLWIEVDVRFFAKKIAWPRIKGAPVIPHPATETWKILVAFPSRNGL